MYLHYELHFVLIYELFCEAFKTLKAFLSCSVSWPPAGFTQSSSSTRSPTFPSGSLRDSSQATSSSRETLLTSATSTSTSLMTGKVLYVYCIFCIQCHLTCVLQIPQRGHGVAVRGQWEQQHGGRHRIPASGTATEIIRLLYVVVSRASVLFSHLPNH